MIERYPRKWIEPKAEVSIVFSGPFQYDDSHKLALRTMVLLLQLRLSDAIRKKFGAPTALPWTARRSSTASRFRVRIDWTCDPARVQSLVQRVFEEIAEARPCV